MLFLVACCMWMWVAVGTYRALGNGDKLTAP